VSAAPSGREAPRATVTVPGSAAMVATPMTSRREAPPPPIIPLFWRLFIPNASVLVVACVVLMVEPANGRVVAIAGGLTIMLVANLLLMRRAFAPLARLASAMDRIDPLRPGERVPPTGPPSEVTLLTDAFNAMLERLETERRESAQRTAASDESDRRHLAAELHDEIGQTLTALVLQIARIRTKGATAEDFEIAERTAEAALDDVRRLARRLRPEALDELGLGAALNALCNRLSRQTGLMIHRRMPQGPLRLTPDEELVVYRIAQESLTNVVRHAQASEAYIDLVQGPAHVDLIVADDGVGLPRDPINGSGGLRSMRERALLIGADVWWERRKDGGTTVRLRVPISQAQDE
jgi:two-component system, NarL family, sensor histidine kinase UhpB